MPQPLAGNRTHHLILTNPLSRSSKLPNTTKLPNGRSKQTSPTGTERLQSCQGRGNHAGAVTARAADPRAAAAKHSCRLPEHAGHTGAASPPAAPPAVPTPPASRLAAPRCHQLTRPHALNGRGAVPIPCSASAFLNPNPLHSPTTTPSLPKSPHLRGTRSPHPTLAAAPQPLTLLRPSSPPSRAPAHTSCHQHGAPYPRATWLSGPRNAAPRPHALTPCPALPRPRPTPQPRPGPARYLPPAPRRGRPAARSRSLARKPRAPQRPPP